AYAKKTGSASLVYTFDPHPAQVLRPEKKHQNLYTRADLIEQLTERGLDRLVLEPFTKEFASQSAKDFLENCILPLRPRHLVVGDDFAFGRDRSGSQAELNQFSKVHNVSVEVLKSVDVDGQPVSSTWIRQCIQAGDLQMAERLLGRPYS